MVVAAGGHHDQLVAECARGFTTPGGTAPVLDAAPAAHAPSVRHEENELQQLYLSLGARGLGYGDPERYPLIVGETLLGGGMSSRLFQRIREDAGLAYSVFTSLELLRDGGSFAIHLGVSPEKGREALRLLREELDRLLAEGPDADEVEAAKMQLKGSVVMAQESVSSRMYHIARQELYLGHHTSSETQVARILAVTRDEVRDVLARYVRPERFSLTALGPAPDGPLTAADWPSCRRLSGAVSSGVPRAAPLSSGSAARPDPPSPCARPLAAARLVHAQRDSHEALTRPAEARAGRDDHAGN